MAGTERKIAAPPANAETKEFWDEAASGTLLIKRCRACARVHYYPRALCPFCGSDATEWQAAGGSGVVYSYSVMRCMSLRWPW